MLTRDQFPGGPNALAEYSPSASGWSLFGGNLDFAAAMSKVAPVLAIGGAVQSGFGAYFSAKSQKNSLEFQSQMSAINARIAETQAQGVLIAGERQSGAVSMKYGQLKGSAKAAMAANGIQAGVGSAAEVIASTDLMKETDLNTIHANAVREAFGYRTQAVNASNQSLLQGTSAGSINPGLAAGTSLLGSATIVASSWYKKNRMLEGK